MGRITSKAFKKSCKKSAGIISDMARLLKVQRFTVYKYIQDNSWAKDYLNDCRDNFIDDCESVVKDHVDNRDLKAAMFVLKTLGKTRGYTEKSEVELSGDESSPITINFVSSKGNEGVSKKDDSE